MMKLAKNIDIVNYFQKRNNQFIGRYLVNCQYLYIVSYNLSVISLSYKSFVRFFQRNLEGIIMNNVTRDIFIGLLFVAGIWSFISGQFIFSTILFASSAIYSNIVMRTKLDN